MKLRSRRRPGFTLLEVLLASLIAVMLLAGLYFAMDVTLRQTQESRDGVVVDGMARDVFNRVGIDLAATLGPLPPKSGGNSAASAGGGSGSSTSTTTTTNDPTAAAPAGTGTAAPASGAATTTTTSGGSTASATPQAAPPQFQAGVIGEDWYMTAFVSRVPGVLADPRGLSQPPDPNSTSPSDLWRVTYWRRDDGRLCRQVRPWVTADDVSDPTSIDRSNEDGDTLADEITNVTFEYFDGSSWASSWDGTTPGPDGVTPTGPPRAVRLTLTFSIPPSRPGGQPLEQTVSQVIPVRTAPGPNTPPLIDPSTDPGTVTPDSSGSGMGGGGGSGSNGSSTTAGAGGAASGAKSSGSASSSAAKSSGSTAGAGSAASSAAKSSAPAGSAASSAPKSSGSPMPATPSTGSSGSRGGTGGGGSRGGGR